MSPFWSWFMIALIVLNLAGCIWLIWYTSKRRGSKLPTGETTGHVWDGDVTELNKPLPRWWVNLFYLTIAFTIGYLVLFPGLGAFRGTLGWDSSAQHDADARAADLAFEERYARFADMPLPLVAADPEALTVGRNLYAHNCAQCHGSDAQGARGFPNLTNDIWQWGGDADSMLTTVLHGRIAVMPPLAAAIGDDAAVTAVALYVQQLSGQQVDPALAAAGRANYEMLCAACHGVEGLGMTAIGAPNLTDDEWIYGSDLETIRHGILHGLQGKMPAYQDMIGPLRTRLVTAYVYSLSPGGQASVAAAAGAAAPATTP